ncbi:MAG: DUF6498-containing protein [Ferruginibacter sp.]
MSRPLAILLIIAFNSVPIFGVAFFHWQPFEAFWFFWMETLVMAVFNTIRIVFSQGQPADAVNTQRPMVYNLGQGIKYLVARIGIFLFYSIFIITFIGFVANNSTDKSNVLTTLLFKNKFFNLGLLVSIFGQAYYLIIHFFRNGAFFTARPDSYAALFDSRQIVIHIAVVLGALGSMFLMKNTHYSNYSSVFIISLLCICKCLAELLSYKPEEPAYEG